ncbi:MAG: hypothetical protein U0263_37595 [Polyangiaceae bacterium]
MTSLARREPSCQAIANVVASTGVTQAALVVVIMSRSVSTMDVTFNVSGSHANEMAAARDRQENAAGYGRDVSVVRRDG